MPPTLRACSRGCGRAGWRAPERTPTRPLLPRRRCGRTRIRRTRSTARCCPQPLLRFLLADEPGTGKTIMAGLYLREMQRLGLVQRALVVAPANLVTKWQADFERFFGGGLRRITDETIQQHGLAVAHDMWVVSLELAAVNPAVQEAIRPDRAGWDLVVFDEAHRLTPTARRSTRSGGCWPKNTPRALLMTATPHRGKEWLFRHLLHLVDPEVYPDPAMTEGQACGASARARSTSCAG